VHKRWTDSLTVRTFMVFGILGLENAALADEPATPTADNAVSDVQRKEDARAIFRQATAAFKAGDFAVAAERFEQANAILPSAATVYNAARAWQEAGQNARAANAYTKALATPGLPADHEADARQQMGVLEKIVGLFDIDTAEPSLVSISGGPEQKTPLRVYVEPGEHEIRIRREAGGEPIVRVSHVAAGNNASLVFDSSGAAKQDDRPAPLPGIRFFARASLGFGGTSVGIENPTPTVDSDNESGHFGGPSVAFELALGASVTPQIAIAAVAFNENIRSSDINYQNKADLDGINVGILSMFGGMVDYNPSGTGGWHYFGALGGASLEFNNAQPRPGTTVPHPFGGFIMAGVGKDWWSAERWRFGALARAGIAAMADGDEKHTAAMFSIMGSATWDFRGRR
jgi:tetratricopeptide (TPR) repeat protein